MSNEMDFFKAKDWAKMSLTQMQDELRNVLNNDCNNIPLLERCVREVLSNYISFNEVSLNLLNRQLQDRKLSDRDLFTCADAFINSITEKTFATKASSYVSYSLKSFLNEKFKGFHLFRDVYVFKPLFVLYHRLFSNLLTDTVILEKLPNAARPASISSSDLKNRIDLSFETHGEKVHFNSFQEKISNGDHSRFILIGEAGVGKSYYLFCLFADLLRKSGRTVAYLAAKEIDFNEKPSMVEETILLVDAVDEAPGIYQNSDYWEQLEKWTSPYAKVVFTVRNEIFESGTIPLTTKDNQHEYFHFTLDRVDAENELVKKYLRKKFPDKNDLEKANQIIANANEVMCRPFVFRELELFVRKSTTTKTHQYYIAAEFQYASQIYEHLIDSWLQREETKIRLTDIDISAKQLFEKCLDFAYLLFDPARGENETAEFSSYNELLKGMSDAERKLFLDRSLLRRRDVGNFYTFIHRSIRHYFEALLFFNGKCDSEAYLTSMSEKPTALNTRTFYNEMCWLNMRPQNGGSSPFRERLLSASIEHQQFDSLSFPDLWQSNGLKNYKWDKFLIPKPDLRIELAENLPVYFKPLLFIGFENESKLELKDNFSVLSALFSTQSEKIRTQTFDLAVFMLEKNSFSVNQEELCKALRLNYFDTEFKLAWVKNKQNQEWQFIHPSLAEFVVIYHFSIAVPSTDKLDKFRSLVSTFKYTKLWPCYLLGLIQLWLKNEFDGATLPMAKEYEENGTDTLDEFKKMNWSKIYLHFRKNNCVPFSIASFMSQLDWQNACIWWYEQLKDKKTDVAAFMANSGIFDSLVVVQGKVVCRLNQKFANEQPLSEEWLKQMRKIPATDHFQIGSPSGEDGHSENEDGYILSLPAFEMSSVTVTVADFAHFVAESGYISVAEREGWSFYSRPYSYVASPFFNWRFDYRTSAYFGKPSEVRHPVVCISWYDAVYYCNWLSRKAGLSPCYSIEEETEDTNNTDQSGADPFKFKVEFDAKANGFRLPTEAEWEYACRAGSSTAFCWEDGISIEKARYIDAIDFGDSKTNKFKETTVEVDTFEANGFGLYNMHGNVAEWCYDWYHEKYDISAIYMPTGAATGTYRVIRGGGSLIFATYCRSAYRVSSSPGNRNSYLGFRLSRNSS